MLTPPTERDRRELAEQQAAAHQLHFRFRHAGAIADPIRRADELTNIMLEARYRPARQRLPLDLVVAYNALEQDVRSIIEQETRA